MRKKAWISWYDKKGLQEQVWLKKNYATAPWPEIRRHCRMRSISAITLFARQVLGLHRARLNPRSYSDKERAILRRYYPKVGWDVLQKMLPGRTPDSMYRQAMLLGIKRKRNWGKDDEVLRKYYPTASREELEKLLKRNWSSITQRASLLRISRRRDWSGEEEDILRALYPSATREEIMKSLPNYTWRAISNHASVLRISRRVPKESIEPIFPDKEDKFWEP